MTRPGSRARKSDDALLIRALERGDDRAIEPLLDRHLDSVYGLLRMTLPTSEEAEAALSDTFCAAAERASDPLARSEPERWLASIALEEVEQRSRPLPPISLEEHRRRRSARDKPSHVSGPEAIDAVGDRALGVLIRTLDLHQRQAIVLGVMWGLEDDRVAAVIGCETSEVERLKRDALGGLAARIREHELREEELKREIEAIPYRLRPLPLQAGAGSGPDGSTVIVGSRVHLEPAQPRTLGEAIRRALRRIAELFRRHRHGVEPGDEAGGDPGRHRSLEPTPSLQPFEKPGSTPTTRGHRTPKLSPGVAVYAMPRKTPTTRRLSNRNRPLPPTQR